jgi:flagellar hook-associated protein 1
MSGVSPLMSLGIKAMSANYAALQVTGHNIANANVQGYSRQTADLATAQGQFTGAGFFGRGVDVTGVSRSHNDFLTKEAASAKSLAAMDGARWQQLQRLEGVFKTGEMGLGHAVSELMTAFSDLTSRPGDMATRQVVLARAADLANRFSEAGTAMDDVQAGVAAQLRASVSEVNGLARSIAEINNRIAGVRGLGQPANDLLDERERLLSRLSEHVSITRIEAEDGTLSVFMGGGQRLVLGAQAAQMQVLQDQSDPSRYAVGLAEGTSVQRRLDAGVLGGGSIAGLLRFQNEDLTQARVLVGQIAASVGGVVNGQQMRGLNLQQPYGSVASQPLFAIGPALAQPHGANQRSAAGNPLGVVDLTITDPGALQASEYELAETNAGSGVWMLTRLSDGLSQQVNSGDVVDGMRIDFAANPPQAGDRFLLQPVTRAANGMGRLLSDPRDVAAASPLLATTAPGNAGTAQASGLVVAQAPLPVPGASARITFTNDQGDYTWDLVDSSNNTLASGTATWQPGQTIPPSGTDINGFTLTLSGVPRNGDILTIEPTPAGAIASNNGNALALTQLRDAAFVGGKSVTDRWANAIADIGVRVQGGETSAQISDAVAGQAELQRSSQMGVNLDEEAARLIQFQQSYQAAAKMLQVAQSLFDTLLSTAGN